MTQLKFILTLFIICFGSYVSNGQKQKVKKFNKTTQPKLVVGVVIDQMRYDYIYRYWDDYSDKGFKKLLSKGYSCENHHFNYAPTYTGPGHASIYTGTTPEMHGVIANNWFSKMEDSLVYCVEDPSVLSRGTEFKAGQMSPHRLLTTTITDQLKLATNKKSKIIGISLKDRGAILPAGHMADAAYWFVDEKWVSSSHYMEALPQWVNEFNNEKIPENYIDLGWSLLKDKKQYNESQPDNNPFEGAFKGSLRPVFPYNLRALVDSTSVSNLIKMTPHGNQLTLDFAKRTIINEQMGKDVITDFLAVSFSSIDYIGHQFGTQSMEIQDAFLRLDLQIADLLIFLDKNVGKGDYLLFLTADHGAVHVPSFMKKNQVPVDYWNPGNMVDDVKDLLNEKYGNGEWIRNYSNDQFFLNLELIVNSGINKKEMEDYIVSVVINYSGVHRAITGYSLLNNHFEKGVLAKIQNGYNQKRSGEVIVITKPGWLKYGTRTGTSHGLPYRYDTHVPLIFYGSNIDCGRTFEETHISDIAPTIAALLRIQEPNGCTGKPIVQVLN